MKRSHVLLVLLLVSMLLVSSFPSALAQKETPQGSTPDSGTIGSNLKYIIKPQDLATLGQVQVIVPEQPVEKAPIQGWIRAYSSTIAIASEKAGAYVGEVASTSYEFSSPQKAQEALSVLPEAQGKGSVVGGGSLLDPRLVQRLANQGLDVKVVHREDEDGLQNYGAWFLIDSYVVDIRITTFASKLSDEITISPSTSPEEQAAEYIRVLSQKIKQGMPFEQLVNRDKARSLGEQLLNHVLGRLIEASQTEAMLNDVSKNSLASVPFSTVQAPSPKMWGSGAHATGWVHQTVDGTPCSAFSLSDACHHLVTWNYTYGNDPHYIGDGGDGLTCLLNGGHGCISEWSWWLLYPQSRLGVPKTFYFGAAAGGAMESWFYTATVWFN